MEENIIILLKCKQIFKKMLINAYSVDQLISCTYINTN